MDRLSQQCTNLSAGRDQGSGFSFDHPLIFLGGNLVCAFQSQYPGIALQ